MWWSPALRGVGDKNSSRHLGAVWVTNPNTRGGRNQNIRRKTDQRIMFYEIEIKCSGEKVKRAFAVMVGLEVVLVKCKSHLQEYE